VPETKPLDARFKDAVERLSYLYDTNRLFADGRASPYFGHMDKLDADRVAAQKQFDVLCAELGRRTAGIDHWTGDGHEHRDDDPTVGNTTAWWDALDRRRRAP
jgi:hypothetical protein